MVVADSLLIEEARIGIVEEAWELADRVLRGSPLVSRFTRQSQEVYDACVAYTAEGILSGLPTGPVITIVALGFWEPFCFSLTRLLQDESNEAHAAIEAGEALLPRRASRYAAAATIVRRRLRDRICSDSLLSQAT